MPLTLRLIVEIDMQTVGMVTDYLLYFLCLTFQVHYQIIIYRSMVACLPRWPQEITINKCVFSC